MRGCRLVLIAAFRSLCPVFSAVLNLLSVGAV
jgi:hypothetical protein